MNRFPPYVFIYGGSLYHIHLLLLCPSFSPSLPSLMVFNSTHIFVPFVIKGRGLRRRCRRGSEDHTAAGWRMNPHLPLPSSSLAPLTNNSSSYPFPPFPHTHTHTTTNSLHISSLSSTPPTSSSSSIQSSFILLFLLLCLHSHLISTESSTIPEKCGNMKGSYPLVSKKFSLFVVYSFKQNQMTLAEQQKKERRKCQLIFAASVNVAA